MNMYYWRKLSPESQEELLNLRRGMKRPWHSPPHYKDDPGNFRCFHLIAACYEHKHIVGFRAGRIKKLASNILNYLEINVKQIHAWVFLSNHYHLLLKTDQVAVVRKSLEDIHRAIACEWNKEDNQAGRRVWCNVWDKKIKNNRHFYATMNYIHNNPVRHKCVKKWYEWLFSSAHEFLDYYGRERAAEMWKEYDCSEMGKSWDK